MQRCFEFEYENEETGEFSMEKIPATWEICGVCDGEGKESAYLGAITQDDLESSGDQDDFEHYLDGGYDRTCECCGGSGKVLTPDWKLMDYQIEAGTELGKIYTAYQRHLEFEADYQRECAMERAMGC